MGRPRATRGNRALATLFANTVTHSSDRPLAWVARKGQYSLYNLLLLLAPKVMQAFVRQLNCSYFDVDVS